MAEKEGEVSPQAQARAIEHQVLSWAHEGLAMAEAGYLPTDFKEPLFGLLEERFSMLETLQGEPEPAAEETTE